MSAAEATRLVVAIGPVSVSLDRLSMSVALSRPSAGIPLSALAADLIRIGRKMTAAQGVRARRNRSFRKAATGPWRGSQRVSQSP